MHEGARHYGKHVKHMGAIHFVMVSINHADKRTQYFRCGGTRTKLPGTSNNFVTKLVTCLGCLAQS